MDKFFISTQAGLCLPVVEVLFPSCVPFLKTVRPSWPPSQSMLNRDKYVWRSKKNQ